MVFHGILNDRKSPQMSKTLLNILTDLNNTLVRMVSILPLISNSSSRKLDQSDLFDLLSLLKRTIRRDFSKQYFCYVCGYVGISSLNVVGKQMREKNEDAVRFYDNF